MEAETCIYRFLVTAENLLASMISDMDPVTKLLLSYSFMDYYATTEGSKPLVVVPEVILQVSFRLLAGMNAYEGARIVTNIQEQLGFANDTISSGLDD